MCFHLLGHPLSLQVPVSSRCIRGSAGIASHREFPAPFPTPRCTELSWHGASPGSSEGAQQRGAPQQRAAEGSRGAPVPPFMSSCALFAPARPSIHPSVHPPARQRGSERPAWSAEPRTEPPFGRALHRGVGPDGTTRSPSRGVSRKRERDPWARCSQGCFPA